VSAKRCSLRLTSRYEATLAEVWRALVEPESRSRWLGSLDATPHELEEGRLLELRLADSVARIELRAEGGGTVLVLDHLEIPAEKGMRAAALWTGALDRFGAAL
jgi:hypothetical protein